MHSNIKPNSKIIVGLSGGVDSAVSAALLLAQGYKVEGLFMKNWEENDDKSTGYCASKLDLESATQVANHLGIKLHKANFSTEYWEKVFEHFLTEYKHGRTPNPDILCNSEIKFKSFLDYAINILAADYIATGHYANIKINPALNQLQLAKAIDQNKDQTYFLYNINPNSLKQALMPLGNYSKDQVRKLAVEFNLPNATRKDSTGICFIEPKKFKQFLANYLPAQPGKIVNITDNKVLGRHNGLMYYTIGQRQGIGIGGNKNYSTLPWYVVSKDLNDNILFVAQNSQYLYKNQLIAGNINWLNYPDPEINQEFECYAKIRYRQNEEKCIIRKLSNNNYQVTFNNPQRAITSGQSIVLYKQEYCLGGGIIEYAT